MSQIKEIAAYWGTRAQGYSERCKIDLIEDTKFDWLDKICKYAPAKQQLNVLDIGCGAGFFSILMAKAGHNVTSIDYTENMVNSAIQNAVDAGVDIEVLQMDAQNLDFEDDTFDLILTHTVPECMVKAWFPDKDLSVTNKILGHVWQSVSYQYWLFGHFHEDVDYPERMHCL